jgi:hypothetical protein
MMSSACDDCVPGVSPPAASYIAARTSGGRFVEVCVISSSRLVERNSIDIIPEISFYREHLLLDASGPFPLLAALSGDQTSTACSSGTRERDINLLSMA